MSMGYDTAPLVTERFINDEQAKEVIVDLAKYALIDSELQERIKDHKHGVIRSIGRFIFRHPSWSDDQYWIDRHKNNVREINLLISEAKAALSRQGSFEYYSAMRSLSGIHSIVGDAAGFGKESRKFINTADRVDTLSAQLLASLPVEQSQQLLLWQAPEDH